MQWQANVPSCVKVTSNVSPGPMSGESHSPKHVREGRLPQAGRRGAPLVRRRDLIGVSQAVDLNHEIDRILGGDEAAMDPDDPFPGDE